MMQTLMEYFKVENSTDLIWLGIGLFAQMMFSMRFLIQWISTERARKSVIPTAFWWFSLFGGMLLFAYGIQRGEPVIILGQSIGIVIYMRNLWFIHVAR